MEKKTNTPVRYYTEAGMSITEYSICGIHHVNIVMEATSNRTPLDVTGMIREFLDTLGGSMIAKSVLFTLSSEWYRDFRDLNPDLPLTCILAQPCHTGISAAIYLDVVYGCEIRQVRAEGQTVGTVFENSRMKCLQLSGIKPENVTMTRADQARRTFVKLEEILEAENLGFTNVVRTWLFIDDILSWYPEFNKVRSEFFKANRIFDGLVPASTGIYGKNPAGSALTADVLAMVKKDVSTTIQEIPSPLQCPAPKYGSSFSRAVEVVDRDIRQLIISGTASIDIDGNSLHQGSISLQIDHTMNVISAILQSRQMNWDNICRAVVYFKNPAEQKFYDNYRIEKGIPDFPSLAVRADICRDELLFEIEVDAVQTMD